MCLMWYIQLEEAVAGKPVNVLQVELEGNDFRNYKEVDTRKFTLLQILGAKRELAAKQDECMEFQRSIGLERIDFKKKVFE